MTALIVGSWVAPIERSSMRSVDGLESTTGGESRQDSLPVYGVGRRSPACPGRRDRDIGDAGA